MDHSVPYAAFAARLIDAINSSSVNFVFSIPIDVSMCIVDAPITLSLVW